MRLPQHSTRWNWSSSPGCHGEITPGEDVVDDILTCSQGDLAQLVQCALMAVTDWRDLRTAADDIRSDRNR
ncbi:hypothetical protein [Yinghuangia sp. YIM S09857]|uniref:hypothetical protein n=1 Tax=Yinghuangia sp. YIM S09857 TaxID=3436929 RepID=UPI003F538CD2